MSDKEFNAHNRQIFREIKRDMAAIDKWFKDFPNV